ncbi:bud emergence protein 1 [Thecaphora frezii]
MKGLKEFRRSLNKDRNSGGKPAGHAQSPSTFTGVKSAVTIQPPKLVIRAIKDYRSTAPHELSFHKGDFFHVTSESSSSPDWFEACNPITNARGLVPASHFDVLSKSSRAATTSAAGPGAVSPTLSNGPSSPGFAPQQAAAATSLYGRAAGAAVTAKGGGGLYAVVKYNFVAERADELEAKAGEPIIVIAQSNFEWFVAKPIGRLGGPGLIPVTFVEIKDLVTGKPVEDVQELIESGIVPKVEEWKKMTAEYKKNTIPLGRFEFQQQQQQQQQHQQHHHHQSLPHHHHHSQQQQQHPHPVGVSPYGNAPAGSSTSFGTHSFGHLHHPDQSMSTPPPKDDLYDPAGGSYAGQHAHDMAQLPPGMSPGEPLPTGLITSATVDSFHFEQGDYWFRIQATHVAGPSDSAPSHAPRAPEGEERDLILYRLYEDFYEFQIALLDHFPAEAGRETDADGHTSERILPLMPGPLDDVDDLITSQRRVDLDQYIVELCALPEYIMRSELVRLFFEPRPGDHCTTHPAVAGALPGGEDSARVSASDYGGAPGDYASQEMQPRSSQQSATRDVLVSNGIHKYSEDQPVGRSSSTSGAETLLESTRNLSLTSETNTRNTTSSSPRTSSSHMRAPSMSSISQPSGAVGTPSPAAGGPAGAGAAPAYHRIKVASRRDKDTVFALRMPPQPPFESLLDKVRERIGDSIQALYTRDDGEGRIHNDDELWRWLRETMEKGGKVMLFAE